MKIFIAITLQAVDMIMTDTSKQECNKRLLTKTRTGNKVQFYKT
jgi:hypothetical protein